MMNPAITRELARARQEDWLRRAVVPPARLRRATGAEPASRDRPRRGAFAALLAAAGLQPRGQ